VNQNQAKKGVDTMRTVSRLMQGDRHLSEKMDAYLRELELQASTDRAKAVSEARQALRRSGVITTKGATKKRIVSWE
jgi:hypothetical protein